VLETRLGRWGAGFGLMDLAFPQPFRRSLLAYGKEEV